MWTYIQVSGWLLRPDGSLLGSGYSGHGLGKNNPRLQNVVDVGPIPCGIFRIGDPVWNPLLGEYSIPLTPDPSNEMFERDDFWMHGDSEIHPGEASKGCIVAALAYREEVVASGDRGLEVIPQERAMSA
jgi:hypothetical protein